MREDGDRKSVIRGYTAVAAVDEHAQIIDHNAKSDPLHDKQTTVKFLPNDFFFDPLASLEPRENQPG